MSESRQMTPVPPKLRKPATNLSATLFIFYMTTESNFLKNTASFIK
jgi:hypothetical protein